MRPLSFLFLALHFLTPDLPAQQPGACIIDTIAGGGTAVPGNGGPALEAELFEPSETAIGPDGSLYIADTAHDAIRRVGPGGAIESVAGTGEPGFSGDGGPATQARLHSPGSMAFGPDGSLYFSDNRNWRIRRVRPDGVIETVVGNGELVPFGEEPAEDTLATETFLGATELAFDPGGNLVFTVAFQRRVRRLNADGRVVTLAGNDTRSRFPDGDGGPALEAALDLPRDIAVGPDGLIVFADDNGAYVRRIAPDGTIDSFAGQRGAESDDGVPLDQASLGSTISLTFDAQGRFVWRSVRRGVRRISAEGLIETLFEDRLFGLSVAPSGDIFGLLSEQAWRWDGAEVAPIAGVGRTASRGDGGPAREARLSDPRATAVGPNGEVYILDRNVNRIRVVDPDGTIRNFAGNGEFARPVSGQPATQSPLTGLVDLAVAPDGVVYIATRSQILRINEAGIVEIVAERSSCQLTVCGAGGPLEDVAIGFIEEIEFDASGNLYIRDDLRGRFIRDWIWKVSPEGIAEILPTQLDDGRSAGWAISMAADPHGDLFITTAFPRYGNLWTYNPESGMRQVEAATGFVASPSSMAPANDGTLFYTSNSQRTFIRALSPDGRINIVAGNGQFDFEGDGGPAAESALTAAEGISLDGQGNLYFADRFNDRVRRVSRAVDCPMPARPQVALGGVVSSASYARQLAPGAIFSIFGRGLGPETPVAAQLQGDAFPTEIAGVRAFIDGIPVPLLFVSAGQLSGIVPYATPIGVEREGNSTIFFGNSALEIEYGGERSEPTNLAIDAAAPAIFSLDQSGSGQGAILNEDGTVNGPLNPARPGSIIVIFGTGGGLVEPAGEDGQLATAPFGRTVAPVQVLVDFFEAEVLYAGEAPGLVSGVLQVNARLPEALTRRGAVPVFLEMGALRSQTSNVGVGPIFVVVGE